MGKSEKQINDEVFDDRMWHHWRQLYNYIDCLENEGAITHETWATMNNSLIELRELLPDKEN